MSRSTDFLACGLALLALAINPAAQPTRESSAPAEASLPSSGPPTVGDPGGLPLVEPADLVPESQFTTPNVLGRADNGATIGEFEYANGAIAFNPANQSLFVVGHAWGQHVAEILIPPPGGTASVLQNFRDVLYGRLPLLDHEQDTKRIGGMFVSGSKLLVSGYTYYDAGGITTASHFVRSTKLDDSDVVGPLKVGTLNPAFYGGYFAAIPPEWQAQLGGDLVVGQCCLSIISRTSYGPAAFSVKIADLTSGPRAVPAQPLVYYPQAEQTLGKYGVFGTVNPVYNGTTTVHGALIASGTRTLLFFGWTGLGKYCYGLGTSDPKLDMQRDSAGVAQCYDPAAGAKGDHAYPYRSYVWAYDLRDLAAVRAGKKRPWSVKPYATWELPDVPGVGGVAYDPATGRVFISSPGRGGVVVYVYKVSMAAVPKSPL